MSATIDTKTVMRLAGFEANALFKAGILPLNFKGSRVSQPTAPIRDISGIILFYRVPIVSLGRQIIYADIAANPIFGSTILAYHIGMTWNPDEITKKAEAAAREKNRDFSYDRVEFVAFSYPKIAVQFLKDDKEVALIELYTWAQVPPEDTSKERYNSRQSILKIIPKEVQKKNEEQFNQRVKQWSTVVQREVNPLIIDPATTVHWPVAKHGERVIHYSPDDATHSPCFELAAQHTGVWCVVASTKMVLDFYRFVYTQDRIAAEEGLGTYAHPNGLPYGQEAKVVNTIEKFSSNGLDAALNMSPNWAEFRTEIEANRPLISLIPGHARCVAGYSQTQIFPWYIIRFLRVYDPWAPGVGVITWENFDAQTYRATFTINPKTI